MNNRWNSILLLSSSSQNFSCPLFNTFFFSSIPSRSLQSPSYRRRVSPLHLSLLRIFLPSHLSDVRVFVSIVTLDFHIPPFSPLQTMISHLISFHVNPTNHSYLVLFHPIHVILSDFIRSYPILSITFHPIITHSLLHLFSAHSLLSLISSHLIWSGLVSSHRITSDLILSHHISTYLIHLIASHLISPPLMS